MSRGEEAEQFEKKLLELERVEEEEPERMGMGGAESRVTVKGRGMKGSEVLSGVCLSTGVR